MAKAFPQDVLAGRPGVPAHFEVTRTTAGASSVTVYGDDGASITPSSDQSLVVESYLISTDTRQAVYLFDDRDDDNSAGPGEKIGGGISIGMDSPAGESGIEHACKPGTVPKLYTSASAHNTTCVGHGRVVKVGA